MNKLELESIIGNKLGVPGKEQKIAADVFIQSVSEYIDSGDTIRIPDIGIFQLKRTEKSLKTGSLNNSSKASFQLFYVPLSYKKGLSEVVVFNVAPQQKKKPGSIEEAFSISIGKPLIPLTGTGRDEHLVQSSFIMLQKNYREKVLGLLENAIHLKDFKLDFVPATLQEDIIQSSLQEEEESYHEDIDLEMPTIPWDFGIVSEHEIPEVKIEKEKINSKEEKFQTGLTDEDINQESFEENDLIQPDVQQEDYESDKELDNDNEVIFQEEEEFPGTLKEENITKVQNENPPASSPDLTDNSAVMNESIQANIASESMKENADNLNKNEKGKEKKSYRWLWPVFFLIIILVGLYYYFFIYKSSKESKIINQDSQIKYKTPALVKGYSSKKDSFNSYAYLKCADTSDFYRLEI